ncbi:MAG: extracellular solute-binding protein [Candidatus Eisenbacteria bacterium]|nr:extracellular solute-binding protein [Candidatus Eisenbacteria bacterium]
MRRVLVPGLLACCAALVLAATSCAPGGGKTPGGSAKGGATARNIVIWEQMDPEERARFEANLEVFKQSHPGVTIQHTPYETEQLRTQFQTAATAGGGPDLIFGPSDQVGPLSILNTIVPLDQTLEQGFFDRFVPGSLDTLNGHLYAAPDQVGNHLVLCFDRRLVPRAPATTAEFIATAKRLTRPGRYGFAMNTTEPYWLVPFLGGFGGWVMDAQARPTLDTPAMVQALAFLKSLRDQHKVMPRESDYMTAETMFKEGKAAMIVNGPWSWSGYRKAGVDLGVAPIFRLPNGQWARPMVASKGYSINVNVPKDRLPLVVELLSFLTSPAAELRSVRDLSILPSSRDAYRDSTLLGDPTLAASRQAIEKGGRMPVVPEMRVIWDVMRPEMQSVMNGVKTPAQAAKDMQRAAVTQIAGMKQ